MKFVQDKKYELVGAFLRNSLTLLDVLDETTWKAFCEVCGSETLAKQAITWGKNPLVHIGGVDPGTNGEYRGRAGGPKNTVFINHRVAEVYQDERRWIILESTVLHEMVHWARYVGGKSRLFNGEEAGKVFEEKAYSADVACGCYAP